MATYEDILEKSTTTTTTTTASSSLPDMLNARSMAAGEPVYASPELTEEQQILKRLANKLLESTTPGAQKLAMNIFAHINSGDDSKLMEDLLQAGDLLEPKTQEEEKLKNLATNLLKQRSTPEQLEIAAHVFSYLTGGEGISGVFAACNKYFRTHEMPGWFSRDEVGKIIKQIYELSKEKYKKELQSASSKLVGNSGIFSFGDDEEMILLSPSKPQRIIDFFNTPGNGNYLFVRMLTNPYFEANMLLKRTKKNLENPINYWLSATAIKNGVPFKTFLSINIGFLYSPDTSVGMTSIPNQQGSPTGKSAWGKANLASFMFTGLDNNGTIDTTSSQKLIEKNPIDKKLEEMRKRRCMEWPDLTTKELYAFLYEKSSLSNEEMKTAISGLAPKIKKADLAEIISLRSKLGDPNSFKRKLYKDPTRYFSLKNDLSHNEVLIHPTIENMLGIVITSRDYLKDARRVRNYIKDNGGPYFPIFLYTPGKLELLEE